jgi:predicted MFS family arabinose efflux permease
VLALARPSFRQNLTVIFKTPAAVMLLAVFGCANFVAAVFLTWLTDFVYTKFGLSVTYSAIVANIFTAASLVGALGGGVFADLAARWPGGRIRVQALGLFVGAPFIYQVGTASTIPLLIVGMIAVGLSKGFYDANIFASVYDVVPAQMRGTTAGLMNTIGWAFASVGPWATGGLGPLRVERGHRLDLRGLRARRLLALVARRWPPGGKPAPGDPDRAANACRGSRYEKELFPVSTAPESRDRAPSRRGRAEETSTPSSG